MIRNGFYSLVITMYSTWAVAAGERSDPPAGQSIMRKSCAGYKNSIHVEPGGGCPSISSCVKLAMLAG